ncbi:MAG: cytochrome c biogenesis protein ResB [Spirochaetia bacterium]|jgi:cytochrome c biogenesis protein
MLYSRRVARLYRFLRSVRLAVVLILVITVLALLATLIPQGRPADWYAGRYPAPVVALIRAVHLDRFFSSALFLAPVFLFIVNLGACAVDRVVSRQRNHAKRRYGPDLIHIGLLVLIAAGLVTALGRAEKTWPLAVGDQAAISPDYSLHLLSLKASTYDNGSPREWTSTVSVTRGGRIETASFPIEVNHPLRLRGLSVYQSTWDTEGVLDLADQQGRMVQAATGQGFQDGESFWYFADTEERAGALAAVFQEYRGRTLVSARTLGAGDVIGPFTVRTVSRRDLTGLKVVRDPGLAPFLAALLLVFAGLCVTFIQKRGDAST